MISFIELNKFCCKIISKRPLLCNNQPHPQGNSQKKFQNNLKTKIVLIKLKKILYTENNIYFVLEYNTTYDIISIFKMLF